MTSISRQASRSDEGEEGSEALDETPIVRFVNKVLIDAIKQGASDIHFEPYEKNYRVRFRTDAYCRRWSDRQRAWLPDWPHASR